MGRVFSWEYFSFLQLDNAVAYKEVLIIPCVLLVLSFIWMQLVRGENSAEECGKNKAVDIVEAYQDALLNEVDSGTELDSQNEEEDDDEEDEEKKKKKKEAATEQEEKEKEEDEKKEEEKKDD